MKNKGFTLVEILITITILGFLSLLVVSTTNNIIKKSEEKAYNTQLEIIKKAAQEYATEVAEDLPVEKYQTYIINISELLDNKYLEKKQIINPKTGENIKGCITVKINSKNKYEYIYSEHCKVEPAAPVLDYNMIPVTIEDNGNVAIADVSNGWYDYSEKKWANAVVVDDYRLEAFKNMEVGQIIMREVIQAYFVWIPRFSYKNNMTKVSEQNLKKFDIEFEYDYTSKKNGDALNDYYTHPAFTFGNKEVNGFWIGKFQTTGTSKNKTILPNMSSNYIYIEDAYEEGQEYDLNLQDLKSYLITNTGWSAVTYLSLSDYGQDILPKLNNNSSISGCGNTHNNTTTTGCPNSFGTVKEYPQSSNGNITGVFDLSGGTEQAIAAYHKIYFDLCNFDKNFANYYEDTISNNETKGHAFYEVQPYYQEIYIGAYENILTRAGNNKTAIEFSKRRYDNTPLVTYRIALINP